MQDREEGLIEEISSGKDVSLERGLLVISGLIAEQDLNDYRRKLDTIHDGYLTNLAVRYPIGSPPPRQHTVVLRARLLFEYLWNAKPRRCGSNVLLTDVIDAQLSADPDQRVGSCVGLTSLYTALGLREGLRLGILTNGSHVLNILHAGDRICKIENTDPLGFDCDLSDSSLVEYPAIMILAHVLNGRGLAREKGRDLVGAEGDYTKAICLNPAYATAYNNRGTIRFLRKDYGAALPDYERAIELDPRMVEAHFNRGLVRIHMHNYREAAKDFDRVLAIDGASEEAHICRAFAWERVAGPARPAAKHWRPLRPKHGD